MHKKLSTNCINTGDNERNFWSVGAENGYNTSFCSYSKISTSGDVVHVRGRGTRQGTWYTSGDAVHVRGRGTRQSSPSTSKGYRKWQPLQALEIPVVVVLRKREIPQRGIEVDTPKRAYKKKDPTGGVVYTLPIESISLPTSHI